MSFPFSVFSFGGDPDRERDERELKLTERDRECDKADSERDLLGGDGERRAFRRGERERDLQRIFQKAVIAAD